MEELPVVGENFLAEVLLTATAVVLACVTLFGVVANALLIRSVLREKSLRESPTYMILVSLAASDLSALLFTPVFISLFYVIRPDKIICTIFIYSTLTTVCSTTYHLLAFAVIRYLILIKPLFSMKYLTAKTTVVICGFIWIVAGTYSLSAIFESDLVHLNSTRNTSVAVCTLKPSSTLFTFSLVTILVFIPLTLTAGFHIVKVCELQKTNTLRQTSRRRQVSTKIIAAILIAFAVSFLPNAIFSAVSITLDDWSPNLGTISYALHGMVYINNAIDPLLYFFCSSTVQENAVAKTHRLQEEARKPDVN